MFLQIHWFIDEANTKLNLNDKNLEFMKRFSIAVFIVALVIVSSA